MLKSVSWDLMNLLSSVTAWALAGDAVRVNVEIWLLANIYRWAVGDEWWHSAWSTAPDFTDLFGLSQVNVCVGLLHRLLLLDWWVDLKFFRNSPNENGAILTTGDKELWIRAVFTGSDDTGVSMSLCDHFTKLIVPQFHDAIFTRRDEILAGRVDSQAVDRTNLAADFFSNQSAIKWFPITDWTVGARRQNLDTTWKISSGGKLRVGEQNVLAWQTQQIPNYARAIFKWTIFSLNYLIDNWRLHLPEEALINSESYLLISMVETGPKCSLRTPTSDCFSGSIFQTRTWPSTPPDTRVLPLDVSATAVQPLLCAFGIAYINFPVKGVKARMIPSFQADTIDFPSREKVTDFDSKLGTIILNNSTFLVLDQMRIDSKLAVAKQAGNS